ncbi:24504_t:CDS:1, partial [Gigaspora rosea]
MNLSILTHRPVFSTKYRNTPTIATIEELHNTEMQLTNKMNKWPVPRKEEGTPINE